MTTPTIDLTTVIVTAITAVGGIISGFFAGQRREKAKAQGKPKVAPKNLTPEELGKWQDENR